MNGEAHVHDDDVREMAYALVDRALTAIGGLDTNDPMKALETVLAMYERALAKLEAS
jgi:hypothetical protein